MLIEIWLLIRVLLSPSCWIRNKGIDPYLDKWLRQQLINPQFSDNHSNHTIKLNGKSIWSSNYPYDCYHLNHINCGLPTRRTVLLTKAAIDKYRGSKFYVN